MHIIVWIPPLLCYLKNIDSGIALALNTPLVALWLIYEQICIHFHTSIILWQRAASAAEWSKACLFSLYKVIKGSVIYITSYHFYWGYWGLCRTWEIWIRKMSQVLYKLTNIKNKAVWYALIVTISTEEIEDYAEHCKFAGVIWIKKESKSVV